MVALALLHSRAGARWVAALVVAACIVLVLVRVYNHGEGLTALGGTTAPLKEPSLVDNGRLPDAETALKQDAGGLGGGSGGGSEGGAAQWWLATPPVFETSQMPQDSQQPPLIASDKSLALHKDIADAMARFIQRPALDHKQAAAQNEAACPREQLEKQVNQDQLHGERDKWLAVDKTKIMEMRRSALSFLEARSEEEGKDALIGPGFGPGGVAVKKGSKGVVIAAGNRRTIERAVICVKQMQQLGWKGGIELWHFEGELESEKDQKLLTDLGVKIHMVSTKKTAGQWKNFELKAEAILGSSFDEVLYLDSDNIPLSDVTALFESPLFTDPRGGQAVFWPDLNRDHPDNAIHRVLGIPCHSAWQLDSGQVLISKSGNGGLNLAALYLAHYMQTEGGYWFSGGDKDTFRYAFLVLGIPYTPAPRWLALLGHQLAQGSDKSVFCGVAMLQYGISPPRPEYADSSDPAHPEPLFVHANLLKHMSGVRKGDAFTQMRRLSLGQDGVRSAYGDGENSPLDVIVGGAKEIAGRGLCSNIWTFGDSATIETVDTKNAFGDLMGSFEDAYFGYGGRSGAWK
ncbi:mannosyltransferase putative-domain-containing protein [Xylariales sp. PMI_506]|nr:mannosyltransferase putative-domain-containing protein [Xylariales sp. PMI_506]